MSELQAALAAFKLRLDEMNSLVAMTQIALSILESNGDNERGRAARHRVDGYLKQMAVWRW